MLVLFAAVPTGSVGLFASRTHWRLFRKGLLGDKGLPLHHATDHGLVHITSSLRVDARIIQRQTNVGDRPRRIGVLVPHTAQVPRLEILFARFTNSQPRIGKLDVELLLETGRCEAQDIPMRCSLRKLNAMLLAEASEQSGEYV